MKKTIIVLFVLLVAVTSAFALFEDFDKSKVDIEAKMLLGFQYGVTYETGKWTAGIENVALNPALAFLKEDIVTKVEAGDNISEEEAAKQNKENLANFERSFLSMGVHFYTMYKWLEWREWDFSVGLGLGYLAPTGTILDSQLMGILDSNEIAPNLFVSAEFETAYYVADHHAITAKFVLPITPATISLLDGCMGMFSYDEGMATLLGAANAIIQAAELSSIGYRYSF